MIGRKGWFTRSAAFVVAVATVLLFGATIAASAAGNTYEQKRKSRVERNAQEARVAEKAVSTLFGILKQPKKISSAEKRVDQLYSEGLQYERAGQLQAALDRFQAALKIDFSDPRVHMAIGRIVESQDPALALFHYQNAFRFSIAAAAEKVPALEVMRRFLIGRYLQYALPMDDPEVSIQLLQQAIALAPDDGRLHAHLASAYFLKKEFEKSIRESRNAIALGVNNGTVHVNLAAAFAQLGKKDEARKELETALNFDEPEISVVLDQVRQEGPSSRLTTFKKLLGEKELKRLVEESAKGMLEKGWKLKKDGKAEEGIAIVRKAAEKYPEHSYAEIFLGDLLRAAGDSEGAKAAYEEALKRNPANQLAYPRLGDLAYDEGEFLEAARDYARGIDLLQGRWDQVDILDRTAVALAREGRHEDAVALLDKWIDLNPNAPEAFELTVRRAGILADAKKTHEAEMVLRKLVEKNKESAAGYIVLHTFYKERGNEKKARQVLNDGIVVLESARDRDPLNAAYYRDLARLYRMAGRERDAVKALLDGGMLTVEKRYFSDALFAAGQETVAYRVVQAWVEAEPRNPEALLSYGWVSARLGRNLDDALAKISALEEIYPELDKAPILRTRGYLRFAKGEYEKAIADFREVLKGKDVAQAGFFHRLWGLAAEQLGRKAEAKEHFKKALELDPEGNADLRSRVG
ncbi:MAG: tetratricopeptide repeat protein [Candidatus Hydrogenedentota bacterium]|nr:MAG: tetratricopeptide repeat protein [Candidatus Hydrogenedentota bacterium]